MVVFRDVWFKSKVVVFLMSLRQELMCFGDLGDYTVLERNKDSARQQIATSILLFREKKCYDVVMISTPWWADLWSERWSSFHHCPFGAFLLSSRNDTPPRRSSFLFFHIP